MKVIASFVGKNRDFRAWLAAQKKQRTVEVNLQRCELCGQPAKGAICRKCEPLFRRWTKKMATEVAAQRQLEN